MLGQLRTIPDWLYYFGGLADKIEGRVIPHDRTSVLNYTLREPLGVVGIIIPWNSPVLLTMYSLAPALAAGNTVSSSRQSMRSASVSRSLRLAEDVGFPPGVINVVTGDARGGASTRRSPRGREDRLHRQRRPAAGSRPRRSEVGSAPSSLELGGQEPEHRL